jgi:cellulose synthase (UDP-forming)
MNSRCGPQTSSIATREPQLPSMQLLMMGPRKIEYLASTLIWLACFVFFWSWWFHPDHKIGLATYTVVTLTLAWITLLPGYFLMIFLGGRKPVGGLRLPEGTRVAMIVTKVPSEPFTMVAETLEAMLAQDYPHDTWLADEAPTLETTSWCNDHGVRISSRQGDHNYHRAKWPRRARCKEGNLAYFYDHFGYADYDIVSQLDADHVPEPGYLREMLRPFCDSQVGYVSAPSICDRNAALSWSARGRLYAEASLHGALQAGYNHGWAPLCIGSHYAVRTAAVREIGGLGPDLAEDHSTTLLMNAHGWRGVHAMDAIAHGDGPRTFADLVTQEFQWSRSLMTILIEHSPKHFPMLSARLRFQFIFAQLWYPLFSTLMALMFSMPIVALVSGSSLVRVTYLSFLAHFMPMAIILIVMAFRWRSAGVFRPVRAKILSWECAIFLFARWPWALAGSLAAVRDWLTGSFVEFRVTPKGTTNVDPLPFRVIAPYAVLSLASALPALLIAHADQARGFYIFAIVNATLYALVFAVILVQHECENVVRRSHRIRRSALATAVLALFGLPAAATSAHGLQGMEALTFGGEHFGLIQRTSWVAGAGNRSVEVVNFQFHWILNGTANQSK